jgi:heptaprenyl diphosphate synthase
MVLPGLYASPRALFLSGAFLFPPFLLQQDLVVRAGLILVFIVLIALAGKRVRLVQFAIVAAGIVLFNLVIPAGKVLASPLGLPLTEGSLKSGMMKATAMTGLMALSQFSIRPSLRLPGRFGGLVGRSLFYFETIMSQRRRIDRADIIGSIDALLLSVGDAPAAADEPQAPPVGSGVAGLVFLVLLVVASWGLLAFTQIHPRPFWGG